MSHLDIQGASDAYAPVHAFQLLLVLLPLMLHELLLIGILLLLGAVILLLGIVLLLLGSESLGGELRSLYELLLLPLRWELLHRSL